LHLHAGQTVMLCPTLGPSTVQSHAERLALQGIDFIDAPMSGGPLRAQQGTMSLMVACSDAVWQRSQKLLTALSQQVFRVGTRAGDGARTKLVNNLLAAVNLAGAAEAMALAERLGLDPQVTLSVIEAGSGAERSTTVPGRVSAVAIAANASAVAVATANGVLLFDGKSLRSKATLALSREPESMAFSADGQSLLVGGWDEGGARGAIAVAERQSYIGRVRDLTKMCAEAWVANEGRNVPAEGV
jgi:hypothetical protein